MAAQWMGFTISIDCGPLGVFQGVVTAVQAEPQSVTLSRVFHNGVPHKSPSVIIRAQDIKDLTIIAAPQAQLDPVVELKKPIPTRPGRCEGAHNFHSQPAPPRTLHLSPGDFEARKATQEAPQLVPNVLPHVPVGAQVASSVQSQDSDHQQGQQPISAAVAVQLSNLQAALPEALKISAVSKATAPVATSGTQGPAKMTAAQVVSHRAQQLSAVQAAAIGSLVGAGATAAAVAAPTAASRRSAATLPPLLGGFKMTNALGSQAPGSSVSGVQTSSQKSQPPSLAQSSQPAQASPSRSSRMNGAETLPLNTAAQALFQGATAQAFPHGALPRSQGASSQGSPQKSLPRPMFAALFNQGAAVVPFNADGYASGSGEGNRTPNRRDRQRQRWQAKDEACFGPPANNGFDQDFDFEKNLALFDKQAVYDEMAVQRPDLVQAANNPGRQQNYRHDQNILVNNRRIPSIIVPNPGSAEYVTDEGLIIPSMRPESLRQLHQKAHDVGFTFDRQAEIFGRCATEMSLQLLGGAHRLNPHNAHQWPTVVVMVGPHPQGTVGVMCARQLECQGVSTVTLVVNEAAAPACLKRELSFYKCSGGPIVTSNDQLPESADLVIMALAGHLQSDVANSLEYGKAASWASNKRAPVLALDPPPVGTPGIITRFALAPTLPLTYSAQNGKIYLCNLGIPPVVFKEMGIRYRSPFGSKFVIPLHPNDE